MSTHQLARVPFTLMSPLTRNNKPLGNTITLPRNSFTFMKWTTLSHKYKHYHITGTALQIPHPLAYEYQAPSNVAADFL